jgi:hypothetical protein
MASPDTNHVFLGLGGPRPGVVVSAPAAADCRPLAELPEGHSVYAVDVHADTGRIGYGTRAGTVHAVHWPLEGRNGQQPCQWFQGSPVLAVCWVNHSQLCSAHLEGQCLLWNVANPSEGDRLPTDGRIICSLLKLPNGELAGLSEDGCLLFWSVSEKRLLRYVQGAVPSRKFALVHLRFWSRRGLLVYPAQDGRLCLLPPDGARPQYVDAHHGPFYVITAARDGLLTVGEEDRLARLWDRLPGNPRWEAMVPWSCPIVGGWSVGPRAESILLIDREGTAALFECADGAVRFLRQLPGASYRTVAGVPREELERPDDTRVTRAAELQTQAREDIRRGRVESLRAIADEMASLGFERMALGVRAQQARLENRPLDELRIRRELMVLLGNDPPAEDSKRRYAFLLETFWRLPEACSAYRAFASHAGADDRDEWLAKAAGIMEGGHFVVEPDLPLQRVIDAATILDQTLTGAWVVTSAEPMRLPPDNHSLGAFLEKYEQVRNSDGGREAVPPANDQTTWWIARDRIEQVTVIDLTATSDPGGVRLRSVLRFEAGQGLSHLTPVLLLDAGGLGPNTSPAVGNGELLRILATAGTQKAVTAQQWEVQRLVTLAYKRLCTESQWRRNQGKEQDHDH